MFFCGAKRIARSIFAGSQNYDGELAFLLDWVYGQDILSKFSLLFWPQKDLAQRKCEKDPYLLSQIENSPHRSLVSLAPAWTLITPLLSYEALTRMVDRGFFRLLDGVDDYHIELERDDPNGS